MIYTFDVKKPIEDITKKLGIDAQGTLKKVIYDKMRESVTFVVEKFKGDAELLKHQLTEFLGVHADVLIEERTIDLANPDNLKEYTMDLLNGSGKYLEKLEIENNVLKVYALGEFAKVHLTKKIEKIKSKLPFEEYVVEISPNVVISDSTAQHTDDANFTDANEDSPYNVHDEMDNFEKTDSIEKDNDKRVLAVNYSANYNTTDSPSDAQTNVQPNLNNINSPSNMPPAKKRAKIFGKIFKIEKVSNDVLNIYITDKKDSAIVKAFNSKVPLAEEKAILGGWYIYTGTLSYDKMGNTFFKLENLTEIPSLDRVTIQAKSV